MKGICAKSALMVSLMIIPVTLLAQENKSLQQQALEYFANPVLDDAIAPLSYATVLSIAYSFEQSGDMVKLDAMITNPEPIFIAAYQQVYQAFLANKEQQVFLVEMYLSPLNRYWVSQMIIERTK